MTTNKEKLMGESESWLVKLSSPSLTDEQEKEFMEWLARSPAHQSAYLEAESNWQRGKVLANESLKARSSSKRSPYVFSAAASFILAIVLVFQSGLLDRQAYEESFVTAFGEQKQVLLNDGTELVLNTDTQVEVSFTRQSRIIHLRKGEAFFNVAKGPDWPFDVITDAGQVRVLGTQFSVREGATETIVTVVEGKVGVRKGGQGPADSFEADVALERNQRVVVQIADSSDAVESVDAKAELAWTEKNSCFEAHH